MDLRLKVWVFERLLPTAKQTLTDICTDIIIWSGICREIGRQSSGGEVRFSWSFTFGVRIFISKFNLIHIWNQNQYFAKQYFIVQWLIWHWTFPKIRVLVNQIQCYDWLCMTMGAGLLSLGNKYALIHFMHLYLDWRWYFTWRTLSTLGRPPLVTSNNVHL